MIVYVLVPTAVYDHGVVGVYENEELARAAAEKIWTKTDGHHAFKVVKRKLNATHEHVFAHQGLSTKYVKLPAALFAEDDDYSTENHEELPPSTS